jgi:Flp pilus assembly protein TadD
LTSFLPGLRSAPVAIILHRGGRRVRWSLAASLLIMLVACAPEPEPELWLIGLDGADWDVLEPLIAQGRLPHLQRLREEGAWGRLRSEEPMLSPVLWTTIATGRGPEEHGITWFMSDGPEGEKIPVSSRARRVRTIWNIASEAGVRCGVIGWWATWPAEPIRGFLVSDYVGWHGFGVSGRELALGGKTHPPELIESVRELMPGPHQVDSGLLQQWVHLPPERLDFDPAEGSYGGSLAHLRQAVATTLGYSAIAKEQLRTDRPQLLAIYYEGTDAVQHHFGRYAPPLLPWIEEEDHAAYRDVVAEYFAWQDERLGTLLESRSPHTTVVLCSDHGFRTADERLKEEELRIDLADRSHMPDGVIILNGPDVRPGTQLTRVTLRDVAPTVLRALGLPIAADLPGRPLEEAWTEEFRAENPLQSVPTYETGPWERGVELDADARDRAAFAAMLRSLGYVSEGSTETISGERGSLDLEAQVNEAMILRLQGRHAKAVEILEDVLRDHPVSIEARVNLAQTYGAMQRWEEAERIYAELRAEHPADLEHCEDLALTLAYQGRDADALAMFERGLEQDSRWARGLAGKGYALHRLGRTGEAETVLKRALELDPRLAEAHYYLGVVQLAQGDAKGGRRSLERARELEPLHVPATLALAALVERQEGAPPAESFLEHALDQTGGDPRIHAQLGALQLRRGDWANAELNLRYAADRLPGNVDVRGNLAMARAMSGDLESAIELFEQIVDVDPGAVEARGQLASLLAQAGRLEEAERTFRSAERVDPANAEIQTRLGTLLHQQGRLDEARRCYERALELEPEHALALYQLAGLVGMQGDEERAWQLLRRARELDPRLPLPPGAPR